MILMARPFTFTTLNLSVTLLFLSPFVCHDVIVESISRHR